MKSITSGTASTSAQKMKKTNKQPLPDATHSLMLATLLQTSLTRKEELFTAFSLLEVVARMVSTASIITRFLQSKTANQ